MVSRDLSADYRLGVGVRHYTLDIEKVAAEKLLPWEFQPVHNTYFLMLNETGVQGLLVLLAFLLFLFDRYWKAGKAVPLFVILLMAPFDHFWWDSWVGMMLIGLSAGFFILENHEERMVEKMIDVITHRSEN